MSNDCHSIDSIVVKSFDNRLNWAKVRKSSAISLCLGTYLWALMAFDNKSVDCKCFIKGILRNNS